MWSRGRVAQCVGLGVKQRERLGADQEKQVWVQPAEYKWRLWQRNWFMLDQFNVLAGSGSRGSIAPASWANSDRQLEQRQVATKGTSQRWPLAFSSWAPGHGGGQ